MLMAKGFQRLIIQCAIVPKNIKLSLKTLIEECYQ